MLLKLVSSPLISFSQTGCTDPQATNYNGSATVNDGSCLYPSTNISLADKTALATPLLDETSGIAFTDGAIWTHNDGGNSNTIYRIDSLTNTVLQSVIISNATNVDWEDITADSNYLYIGDVGNNNGNRQNLKIYRISKMALTSSATSVVADVINYTYSDQFIFTSLPNNNNFDCESVIYSNDSLHLFSKNWVDKKTKHYVLPRTPGTYTAYLIETLNAGFLVTGAGIQANGVIALLGYNNIGVAPIYIYMLYDYSDNLFFSGNKRMFNVSNALTYGQTEGIDFRSGGFGYISNERSQQSIFNIAPKLRSFNITPYLPVSFLSSAPVSDFIQSNDSICPGTAIQFTDSSKNLPTSWLWNFPGGTPTSSILKNPLITYNTPGPYDVSLTTSNASGTNTKIKSATVIVNNLPISTITPNGPVNFCIGGSVVLSAPLVNGHHYQWKRGNAILLNAVNSNYKATSSGNYSVLIIDANTCTKQSAALAITGPPSSSIIVTGLLNVCNGDSVKLKANSGAGLTYQWQKGGLNIPNSSNQIYYGKNAGIYRVVVSNNHNCSRTSATKTITNNCFPLSMKMDDEHIDFNLYPNPFRESFQISTDQNESITFTIIDMTGKEVIEQQLLQPDETSIQGHDLKPGIYFVRFISEHNSWVTRIIKTNR